MFIRPVRKPSPEEEALIRTTGQLTCIGLEPETAAISYLGYPLALSPNERRILFCFFSAMEAGHPCVSADELHAVLDATPAHTEEDTANTPHSTAASRLSVYLHRINEKAADIGGRKLILRDRHRGYRLNPYM